MSSVLPDECLSAGAECIEAAAGAAGARQTDGAQTGAAHTHKIQQTGSCWTKTFVSHRIVFKSS